MDSVQESTITALKSIRALVGGVAFEAAVASLRGEALAPSPQTVDVATNAEPAKPPRTRRLTDEQREAAKTNMAAMQAFIKVKRTALPDATHKEVQRQAGAEWKVMTKAEKDAWYAAHLAPAEEAPKVAKVAVPLGPAPAARGRGRPPKELAAGRLNVRRLSKTETEEGALPGTAE
jgi:hypothetical protein